MNADYPTPIEVPKFCSLNRAAAEMHITAKRLAKAVRQGQIRATMLGDRLVIPVSEIQRIGAALKD